MADFENFFGDERNRSSRIFYTTFLSQDLQLSSRAFDPITQQVVEKLQGERLREGEFALVLYQRAATALLRRRRGRMLRTEAICQKGSALLLTNDFRSLTDT